MNFTLEEKAILAKSSLINGQVFPPFASSDTQPSTLARQFDSPLGLSRAQSLASAIYACPPSIFELSKSKSTIILQGPVQNCTFICTLNLVSQRFPAFPADLLFPCTHRSSSGRYTCRLWFNGVSRLVVISDALPMSKDGHLLCATTSPVPLLWPALVEKAYCKLLSGDYDFWQGSNPGLDAYVLLGWPPERISLSRDEPDLVWTGLRRGLALGDNLVTATTNTCLDEAQTGLARGHAYALVDARQLGALQVVKLYNPWGRCSWSGFLSNPKDWPDALKATLRHNDADAARGYFWMPLSDARLYFTCLYVNWNLELFPSLTRFHVEIPGLDVDEQVHLGNNHQFALTIPDGDTVTWIVLARHVYNKAQVEGTESQALTIHLTLETDQRVFFPLQGRFHHYSTGPLTTIPLENIQGKCVITLSRFKPGADPVAVTVSIHASKKLVNVTRIPPFLRGGYCVGSGAFADEGLWIVKAPQGRNVDLRVRLEARIHLAILNLEAVQFSTTLSSRIAGVSAETRQAFTLLEWGIANSKPDELIVLMPKSDLKGDYLLTVECGEPGLELVPPTDKTMQASLRRLLAS